MFAWTCRPHLDTMTSLRPIDVSSTKSTSCSRSPKDATGVVGPTSHLPATTGRFHRRRTSHRDLTVRSFAVHSLFRWLERLEGEALPFQAEGGWRVEGSWCFGKFVLRSFLIECKGHSVCLEDSGRSEEDPDSSMKTNIKNIDVTLD